MTRQRKWLLIVCMVAAAAAAIALALGVSPVTLLLVGVSLLCPAMMFFSMIGMQHGGGHWEACKHSEAQGAKRKPEERDFKRAA